MLWHGHKRDTEELLSVHLFLNSAGETELTVSEKKRKKRKSQSMKRICLKLFDYNDQSMIETRERQF